MYVVRCALCVICYELNCVSRALVIVCVVRCALCIECWLLCVVGSVWLPCCVSCVGFRVCLCVYETT